MSYREPGSFEIMVICNVEPGDSTPLVAAKMADRFDEVVAFNAPVTSGKGAALKWGVRRARGKVIGFIDADLPFDPGFLRQASQAVEEDGAHLVVANRRHAGSRLDFNRSLFGSAYRRHLLGKAFNGLVRTLLPIQIADTQAGAKVMSRRLALEAFERVTCPGFLFDLEILLCARAVGLPVAELPVTMTHHGEQSTVHIGRLATKVLWWLFRIAYQNQRHGYAIAPIRGGHRSLHVASASVLGRRADTVSLT